MRHLNLDQFRTTTETGGVLSVSVVADGGMFHIEAETRRGHAVLTKARGSDLRRFRDITKAMGLLRELGIREARIDTKNWHPEQAATGRVTRPDRALAMRQAYESAEIVEAAVTAGKSYEDTGLHLTWNETRDWMKTWGKDNEPAAPECHK